MKKRLKKKKEKIREIEQKIKITEIKKEAQETSEQISEQFSESLSYPKEFIAPELKADSPQVTQLEQAIESSPSVSSSEDEASGPLYSEFSQYEQDRKEYEIQENAERRMQRETSLREESINLPINAPIEMPQQIQLTQMQGGETNQRETQQGEIFQEQQRKYQEQEQERAPPFMRRRTRRNKIT